VESVREGESKVAEFVKGNLTKDHKVEKTTSKNGTTMYFVPDETIFHNFQYRAQHVEKLLWNYCYLNSGLTIVFNGQKYKSENGLKDLLAANMSEEPLYQPVHLRGDDIEVAITHTNTYGEDYYSFVNGQYTTQGGTHQAAFREAYVKVIRDFFGKDYEAVDIRSGIVAAVAVKVVEPVFESQTKTKLGSNEIEPNGKSMKAFVLEFLQKELDNYLHKNPDAAQNLQKKILQSERERKELQGIQKLARDRAKKANLHNKKLRDCKVHFIDSKEDAPETTLFITEGDSCKWFNHDFTQCANTSCVQSCVVSR
jgi:topoisomerase-4 subunit B